MADATGSWSATGLTFTKSYVTATATESTGKNALDLENTSELNSIQIPLPCATEVGFSLGEFYCPGVPITFFPYKIINGTVAGAFTSSSTITWNFGDGNTGTGLNPTHTYATPGFYTITGTVVTPGCPNVNFTTAVNVVNCCPSYSILSQNACVDDLVTFVAAIIPASGGTYTVTSTSWDFGDNSPTSPTAAHTYLVAGTYTVTLTVTSIECGAIVTTKNITISDCSPILCPEPEIIITGKCTSAPTAFLLSPTTNLSGTNIVWDFGDGTTGTGITTLHQYTTPNNYTVTVTVTGPTPDCNYTTQQDVAIECCECRTSFAPQPGGKYVLSAWVKETQEFISTNSGLVEKQVETYTGPQVFLEFTDIGGAISGLPPFVANKTIVEGWQQIEKVFVVPAGAVKMSIRLANSGANDVYFDDVRVHPFNSSMKSYVYDPVSLRLWSELDDRNYATFYEYDEQGNLTRIKKETERGVVTIQESREGQYKEVK